MSMHALSTSARSGTSAGQALHALGRTQALEQAQARARHKLGHRLKYRQGTSMGAGASAPPAGSCNHASTHALRRKEHRDGSMQAHRRWHAP